MTPSLLGNISTCTYTILLRKLFGFYQPMEERILEVPGLRTLSFEIERRQKTPLLARDLLHLGTAKTELDRLPPCERLPRIIDTSEALGCLYVLEGATLGGQVIVRHLKRTLPVDENGGCAFFSSYGNEVGRMWKSFQVNLRSYCAHREDSTEVIVSAARQTFVSLDEWLFGEGDEGWLAEGS